MTKPTSRLVWWPDFQNPLAIRALWIGAGGDYSLIWGDDTDTPVGVFEHIPIRHAYPKDGTYRLVARRHVHGQVVEAVEQVVVRAERSPQAELDNLGAGQVRLRLRGWGTTTLHHVTWGDGTPAEQFGSTQLAVEHTYPPGTTKPVITVDDVPARRSITMEGPTVPPVDPPPAATARAGFWPERFELDRPGPGEIHYVTGKVLGDELAPGQRVGVRLYGGGETYATADGEGYLILPDQKWVAGSPQWYPPFRTAVLWWPEHLDDPDWPIVHIPCQVRDDETQKCVPVYLWDLDDPMTITLDVMKPRIGRYRINWGDGGREEVVQGNGFALHARHTYETGSAKTITVIDPHGDIGKRVIAAPDFHEPWISGTSPYFGVKVATAIKNLNGGDWYTPLFVDWGWKDRDIPLWTHPTSPDGKQNTRDCWYPDEYRGKTMTVTVYGPLRPPQVTEVRIPPATEKNIIRKPPRGLTGKSVNDDLPTASLTQSFHVNELKPNWYSAWFTIRNPGRTAAPWTLEFALDAPAVLASVSSWRGTATQHDLGGGRWRITCDQPIPAGEDTRLDITVDPCGDPRIWPTDVSIPRTQQAPGQSPGDA